MATVRTPNQQLMRFSIECSLFKTFLMRAGRLALSEYKGMRDQLVGLRDQLVEIINELERNQFLPDGTIKPVSSRKVEEDPQDTSLPA